MREEGIPSELARLSPRRALGTEAEFEARSRDEERGREEDSGATDHLGRRALGDTAPRPLVAPMGTHVLECSGNGAFARFGMLSAATWEGVPMAKVLFASHAVGAIVLPLMVFHQMQLMVCAVLAQRYARRQD